MGSLTVIKPGLFTNLQDQGRPGFAFYAIPGSGPLDANAAALANAILLNEENAATIECHFTPPTLRFNTDAHIALTGADMNWRLDGVALRRHETLWVHAGAILSGTPATEGCRAYIGLHGSIETERTFGSASCYALCGWGGNGGKPLAPSDTIRWRSPSEPPNPIRLKWQSDDFQGDALLCIPGPQFDWLTSESKSAFATQEFSVTPDSDRMGARLSGPVLETDGRQLTDSLPLLPGFIQLTPAGQAIVVLSDGQTTGGYPRIAFLPQQTLCQLSQIPLQSGFRFEIDSAGVDFATISS